MFCYCGNNSINRTENGKGWFKNVLDSLKLTKEKASEVYKKSKQPNKASKSIANIIKKTSELFSKHFVVEGALGLGVSGDYYEYSKSFGFGYNDGKVYNFSDSNKTININAGISSYNFGEMYRHNNSAEIPEDMDWFDETKHKNVILNSKLVSGCPNTSFSQYSFNIKFRNTSFYVSDKNSRFFGLDFSEYDFFGVHLKIGFEYEK